MNWVKIKGSDRRLEYPSKRINNADGTYSFADDTSAQPTERKVPPTVLEDNGDGTYTQWFGNIGITGRLSEETKIAPISNAADRKEVARIEALINRNASTLDSQFAVAKIMDGKA